MTKTLTTSFRKQFGHGFAEWRRRWHSRDELMCLSDYTLRDIGLTRADACFESAKPFWIA